MERAASRLLWVKILHTVVWVFYNVVLLYLFYAIINGKIDKWVWICIGLFAIEGLVLLLFKNVCPLTIVARRYSDSQKANFDIFIPEWLARHNKLVYSILLGICLLLLGYRLVIEHFI